MKLVSYLSENGEDRVAIYHYNTIFDLNSLDASLPDNMSDLLWEGEKAMRKAHKLHQRIVNGKIDPHEGLSIHETVILAPVPYPSSCRDGYAFRQHVEAARRNRGLEMIKEFDQYPVFYFTNHQAIFGEGDIECMPDHFQQLDFELEVAIVIGKQGRNIRATEADNYIAGYMIMNDFSARTLQMEEMLLNLGPAKGKDFATALGPWLVTPDELEPYRVDCKPGHIGQTYHLTMIARVNGIEVSRGNLADMDWTFAEIIERCSYGVDLFPGDVIGSGTVGTGCFLELNGTKKRLQPEHFTPQWLQPNDVVELEITGLGILKNRVIKANTDYSILALKKNL